MSKILLNTDTSLGFESNTKELINLGVQIAAARNKSKLQHSTKPEDIGLTASTLTCNAIAQNLQVGGALTMRAYKDTHVNFDYPQRVLATGIQNSSGEITCIRSSEAGVCFEFITEWAKFYRYINTVFSLDSGWLLVSQGEVGIVNVVAGVGGLLSNIVSPLRVYIPTASISQYTDAPSGHAGVLWSVFNERANGEVNQYYLTTSQTKFVRLVQPTVGAWIKVQQALA